MNRVGAAVLVLALAASPALAQNRLRTADTDGDGKISRAEYLSASITGLMKYDADHNDKVTRAELPAMARTPMARPWVDRFFADADRDHDGAISRAEIAGLSQANFAKADTDKDGFLSEAEAEAARKAQRGKGDGAR